MHCIVRILARGLAALSVVLALPPAHAGQITGQVLRITTYPGEGKATVQVAGTVAQRPACNTTSTFALPLATDAGKALLGVATAAHARRSPVTVQGTGTCTLRSGSEDIAVLDLTQAADVLPVDAVAICASASGGTQGRSGDCTCNTGKYIVPKQLSPTGCSIKTNTGLSCNANAMDGRNAACCLCAP